MDTLYYGLEPNPLRKEYEKQLAWKEFYGEKKTAPTKEKPQGRIIFIGEYFRACDLVQDAWDNLMN